MNLHFTVASAAGALLDPSTVPIDALRAAESQ
jgi:hypothetical protein